MVVGVVRSACRVDLSRLDSRALHPSGETEHEPKGSGEAEPMASGSGEAEPAPEVGRGEARGSRSGKAEPAPNGSGEAEVILIWHR